MADAKDGFEFFERGGGVGLDMGLELLGIEFAPFPPTRFRGQGVRLGGGQIAVHRAPPQVKAPRRLGLGTPGLNKFDDPFSQV